MTSSLEWMTTQRVVVQSIPSLQDRSTSEGGCAGNWTGGRLGILLTSTGVGVLSLASHTDDEHAGTARWAEVVSDRPLRAR